MIFSVPTGPKIDPSTPFPDLFTLSFPFLIPLPNACSDLNKAFGSLTQVQLTVFMSCGSPLQYSVLLGSRWLRGRGGSALFVSLLLDITESMSRRRKTKIGWTLPSSLELGKSQLTSSQHRPVTV